MKALVTGGAGFIGSSIVKLLIGKNCEVRVIDNLSSGHESNLKGTNIEFIEGDIRDAEKVQSACKGVDVVFHLAASVGRQKSIDNPQSDSSINLLGTLNLLEAMNHNNVSRIIYSSSAAIFGELITPNIDENHPLNPNSPYGVSKLAGEKMVIAYCDIYGIANICLRYFNVYGVNQRYDTYGNVIPIFAKHIFAGEPISIFDDGEQTRDFLNVDDVARVNYLAATKKVESGIYNIGSGNSITINRLAEMMFEKSGRKVNIEYKPPRRADVRNCKAQIDKAKRELDFIPSIDLNTGLTEYLDWFKQA